MRTLLGVELVDGVLALAAQALHGRLQLHDHRRLLLVDAVQLGSMGLGLCKACAHLLRSCREFCALLARARQLQLVEARLVAQLDGELLHLLHGSITRS